MWFWIDDNKNSTGWGLNNILLWHWHCIFVSINQHHMKKLQVLVTIPSDLLWLGQVKKQRPWLGPGELATLYTALWPQRQRGGVLLHIEKLVFCFLGVFISSVMVDLEIIFEAAGGEIFFTPLTVSCLCFKALLTDSLELLQLGARLFWILFLESGTLFGVTVSWFDVPAPLKALNGFFLEFPWGKKYIYILKMWEKAEGKGMLWQ